MYYLTQDQLDFENTRIYVTYILESDIMMDISNRFVRVLYELLEG